MQLEKQVALLNEIIDGDIPDDYTAFLKRYGTFANDSVEIYGLSEDLVDINKIPSVIAATKLYKLEYRLSEKEIVIAHSGIENILVCLNVETGNVYELDNADYKKELSTTFANWFKSVLGD